MVGFASQWIPVHLWWCSSNWFWGALNPVVFLHGEKVVNFKVQLPHLKGKNPILPGNLPLDGPLRFNLQGFFPFPIFPMGLKSWECLHRHDCKRDTCQRSNKKPKKSSGWSLVNGTNKKEGSEYFAMNKPQPPGIINPSILSVNDFDSKLFYPLKLVRICRMHLQ